MVYFRLHLQQPYALDSIQQTLNIISINFEATFWIVLLRELLLHFHAQCYGRSAPSPFLLKWFLCFVSAGSQKVVGWQDVIYVTRGTMRSVYLFQRTFHGLTGPALAASNLQTRIHVSITN